MNESLERVSNSKQSNFPYSPAVVYGNLVFISGTVGRNPETGQIAVGDVEIQTRQTMMNIQKRLEEAGSSFDKTLKVTIFLTSMDDFARMNAAYRVFFTHGFPARSCVQVSAVPDKEALVEIELVAGR